MADQPSPTAGNLDHSSHSGTSFSAVSGKPDQLGGCQSSDSATGKKRTPDIPKYRSSKGKKMTLKCRFCNKELKYQNYETHLKSQHPGSDHKDLRSKFDNPIMSMLRPKRLSRRCLRMLKMLTTGVVIL